MTDTAHFKFWREEGIAFFSFAQISSDINGLEAMHQAFKDCCDEIEAGKEIRVLVIELLDPDAGNAFETADKYRQWKASTVYIPSIVTSVAGLTIPVLIAMDGIIKGPMLEFALACDVRLASKESRFVFDHISKGLIPFEGGTQRLPRVIGTGKAMKMILTGAEVPAVDALVEGLIHEIKDKESLLPTAVSMARKMTEGSPISMMFAKEAVLKGMDLTLEQGLRLEADLYFLMHSTADRVEGISAFRKKRKPVFKGS